MRQRKVAILLRVPDGHGRYPYYPAVTSANGTLRPFYALIQEKPVLSKTAFTTSGIPIDRGNVDTNMPASILTRCARSAFTASTPSPGRTWDLRHRTVRPATSSKASAGVSRIGREPRTSRRACARSGLKATAPRQNRR